MGKRRNNERASKPTARSAKKIATQVGNNIAADDASSSSLASEDVAFFDENAGYSGFLDSIDVSAMQPIGKRERIAKKKEEKAKAKAAAAGDNADEDDDEDNDDNDEDDEDDVQVSVNGDVDEEENDGDDDDDDDDDDDEEEEEEEDSDDQVVADFEMNASIDDDDESVVSFDPDAVEIAKPKSLTLIRKPSKRLPIKDQYGRLVDQDDDDDDEDDDARENDRGGDDERAFEGGSDESEGTNSDAGDGDGDDDDDDAGDEDEEKLEREQAATLRRARKRVSSALFDDIDALEGEERVEVARERIAAACDSLLQAPEANVALLADLEHAVLDSDPTVCRLAILSLLAVFRQILPTYNIRSDYSKETETQVSRAVADLRRFELSLHNAFTTYVNDVTYMLMHKRTNASVKQSCVRALGGILSSRPDTNQRIKIVSTLIAAVCVRDDLTALEACRQVAAILDADPDGQLSLHLVRSVNRVLKAHPYRVRPQLLEALRSVHLRESMTDVDPSVVRDGMRTGTNSRRAEGHLSHQESRNRKAMRKIEHDMREAHSKRTKDRRVRVYIDLLNAVFLIYFRVLKQLPHTALLPLALDGCAKFAHLINIEMMNDLLRVLEKLLKSAATNPAMRELPVRLKCILAGYRSLRNQGYVIDIDVKQFSSELYEQLLYMPNVMLPNPIDANDYVAELLYAVYVAVCEQPNNEVERAAAFAKRVATLALSLAPNQAIAAIVTIQHIIRKYPRVSTLLDTETAVSGVHLPWVEDPAHCNAMAASFWELAALSSHWHPTVRKYALATVQSKFARLDPDVSLQSLRELVHGLDVVSRGTFDPAVREPPAATQKRSRSAHAYLEKQDQFVMRNIDAQRLKARAPAELAHADAGKASALPNDAVARFRRRRANKRLEKRIAAMEVQLEAAKHYAANKSTKTKQKQRQQ